jgi:hypothetical protein
MSKQLDLSNPSSLSEEDAQYAFDRGLISEEQYNEATGRETVSDRPPRKVRVVAHETGSRLVPVEDDEDSEDVPDDEDTVVDYDSSYNKEQIEELLVERGIDYPKSGTKAQWIELLEEDDADSASD